MANEKSNNYKISTKNKEYKSLRVVTSDGEKWFVGVPTEFDHETEDFGSIIANQIPYVVVDNYYERLLQLSGEKRSVVNDIIDYALETGKATIHMGENLKVLFNHIYCREGFSIAKILEENCRIIGEPYYSVGGSDLVASVITNYNKMCKTATFKRDNMLITGLTCAYNFITPSFIKNGKGYMYIFTDDLPQDKLPHINEIIEKYLHDQFKEYYNRDIDTHTDYDKIYDMEYCFDNLVGVKGKYKKIEIQSMYKFIHLDKYFDGLINKILDKK